MILVYPEGINVPECVNLKDCRSVLTPLKVIYYLYFIFVHRKPAYCPNLRLLFLTTQTDTGQSPHALTPLA